MVVRRVLSRGMCVVYARICHWWASGQVRPASPPRWVYCFELLFVCLSFSFSSSSSSTRKFPISIPIFGQLPCWLCCAALRSDLLLGLRALAGRLAGWLAGPPRNRTPAVFTHTHTHGPGGAYSAIMEQMVRRILGCTARQYGFGNDRFFPPSPRRPRGTPCSSLQIQSFNRERGACACAYALTRDSA